MSHYKNLFLSIFFVLIIQQINFAQNNTKSPVSVTSAEILSGNVNVYFVTGILRDSIIHIVWENYDQNDLREVILESSNDGVNFTQLSEAIVSSVMDIHLNNYPKEINYNNNILMSTEHGNVRYLYNDVVKNRNIKIYPKWYRLKMITFTGYLYISQKVSTNGSEQKENNDFSSISENVGKSTILKGNAKIACPSVGTAPSGYTITSETQTYYGNCCYWIETRYEATGPVSTNCGGNSFAWCCNNVPGATECSSGYVSDPCCVHYCDSYDECTCPPWQCCTSSIVSEWVVSESGQITPPSNPAPVATPSTICQGASSSLSASVSGCTIYWFTGSCGGTFVASGSPISVSPSGTTTYYAWSSDNTTGCTSGCGSVTLTVNPAPGAVSVSGSGTYCNSATLNASGGSNATIYWQGTTSNGTSTATPSNSQVVTSSGTYYFRAYNSCGWGTQGSATVVVNTTPTPTPTASPPAICASSGSSVLTASVPGTILYWYTGSCGGTFVATGNSYTTPTLTTTTTYYVWASNNTTGCTSGCATVTISVNTTVTPTFTALGPYCVGATPGTLPGTSNNGVTGTWNPATISTASVGTITYTFTPTAGQCAINKTMNVVVIANSTPTFTALGPYCVGSSPGTLPATSNNGIAGNWSPATISTASPGTTTYTFTPTAGQCASNVTMNIVINSSATPTFTNLGPYCTGESPGTLPTTSTNGIAGTWNPGSINTASAGTTTYTFTPTANLCASTTTMNVVVNTSATPTFTALGPYCIGDSPGSLPSISANGISGTWSPATISTVSSGTTVYTFTPGAGQCATGNATMSIVVNEIISGSITGGNSPICYNINPGTLTVTGSGGSGIYTYLWYKNGSSTGVTTSTYNPGNLTSNTTFYCVITSSPCDSANTPAININVYPELIATISGGTTPICNKTSPGTFTATASEVQVIILINGTLLLQG